MTRQVHPQNTSRKFTTDDQRNNTPGASISSSNAVLGDLEIELHDWTSIRSRTDAEIILENPNGYELPIVYATHKRERYVKIGNSTYLLMTGQNENSVIKLESVNAIGNYLWFKFFNRKYSDTSHNAEFYLPFEDPMPNEVLRLYPVNPIFTPSLMPDKVSPDILDRIRKALFYDFGGKDLRDISERDCKGIKYNFYRLINYLAIIALNGDSEDYYDAQSGLNALRQWVKDGVLGNFEHADNSRATTMTNTEIIALILRLKDHILICRTGANWEKWRKLRENLRRTQSSQNKTMSTAGRTKTLFERKVAPARLRVPSFLISKDSRNAATENWQVVRVNALGSEDVELLADKSDIENASRLQRSMHAISQHDDVNDSNLQDYSKLLRRATVYGFGETLIANAIMVSLAFAGGSATTVKKILRKNKLVHLALKVKTSASKEKWISLLHARAGMMLGQNPNSKIVFITNVEGSIAGESESSTLEFLRNEYKHELSQGQIYNVNQRSGFLLDEKTGRPLRYQDGHVAIVAENHLWAFFGLLLDKNRVVDIIQYTTGIVSLGNGDNILNYPRAGMLGEIEYARRLQARAVATVAIAALSAGDKKGGFAAKVTYRNTDTGDEFHQIELREISEFPTRGKSGFSAIDISGEGSTKFYEAAAKNRWFIEDIFQNPDGTDRRVAFNVAFYAVDLRLIIARIFGLSEDDRELPRKLQQIDSQEWVDRIIDVGEAVPAIEHLSKGAPNEDGSEEANGYMTEQMVQDFIVNALALLDSQDELPQPEVVIRLCERKDFFLPYKGKSQYQLDEDGNPISDPSTGKVIETYDLIANQKRYAGVVRDHLSTGHQLVLGPGEYVKEVIPIDLDMVKEANTNVSQQENILFKRGN